MREWRGGIGERRVKPDSLWIPIPTSTSVDERCEVEGSVPGTYNSSPIDQSVLQKWIQGTCMAMFKPHSDGTEAR